ncbi:MAG: Rpp14/Pop5 family protein [Methanosarcinaceae archaeon]
MKILPPTLRDKKRYLAFELLCEHEITREDFLREMFLCVGSLIGDVGSSECGIRLLTFEDSKGIIRCAHTKTELTRAAVTTIMHISGKRVLVHILGVSGTIAGATEKYLEGIEVFTLEYTESGIQE